MCQVGLSSRCFKLNECINYVFVKSVSGDACSMWVD